MKFTHFVSMMMIAVSVAAIIVGCSSDDPKQDYNPLIDNPQPEQPAEQPTEQSGRDELYRPQVHFTPARNWINDPNGLVLYNGTYHLFYQYNPQGNDWGNMSWGHATSSDLMHWTEQPVALTRDELGAVFSGSAVVDKDNTAGFGANAMVAVFTSSGDDGKQQQSIAYSTDGGKSFARYSGNPVIKNDDDNLRDPKVFWHEQSKQWIMALAKGWKMGVEFYGSTDLKSWRHLSTFFVPLAGRPSLQWECPDLLQFGDKWVLIVSVNPGGPVVGSGTMYFVGQFDGTTFTADDLDYPLWLDYGMDNYAGVTWSNTGDRRVMIGWMNNWQYAGSVPCSPWRSAMTLPRELKLATVNGQTLLTADVVNEIETIAGEWQTIMSGQEFPEAKAYHVQMTLPLTQTAAITLQNGQGEKLTFDVSPSERAVIAHRTSASGLTNFNGTFSVPSMRAPLNVEGSEVQLDFYIDQSSVELLSNHGAMSQTMLVYPASIYNSVSVTGVVPATLRVRPLKTIW